MPPSWFDSAWSDYDKFRLVALREIENAEFEAREYDGSKQSNDSKKEAKKRSARVDAAHKKMLRELNTKTFGDQRGVRPETQSPIDKQKAEIRARNAKIMADRLARENANS